MKKILFAFLLLVGQAFAIDRLAFLQCIAIQENSWGKAGKAGELGPYQMMPKTVRDAGGHDLVAALSHLEWLERSLKAKGVKVNAFNLALCWNAGLTRATTGKAKLFSYDYALHVDGRYYRLTR